jgi:uncharacterized protein YqeY
MAERDAVAASAIRSAMSAVDNAGAVDLSREPAPAGGPSAAIRLGVGAAAAEYQRLGRAAQAIRLKAEAAVLQSFLDAAHDP